VRPHRRACHCNLQSSISWNGTRFVLHLARASGVYNPPASEDSLLTRRSRNSHPGPTPSAVLFPDDSGTIPAIFLPGVVSLHANNEGQWTPGAHAEVIAFPLLCLFVSQGQT